MAQRKWTAKERALVVAHYGPLSAEPWPTREIARALGCTEKDVREVARRAGRVFRPKCHRVSRQHLGRLCREGLDDPTVAALLGCAVETVQRIRTGLGLPANGRPGGHHRKRGG